MPKRSRVVLLAIAASTVAGCAARAGRVEDARAVVLAVRNSSATAVRVRVCPPSPCLPPREVAGGAEAEFRFAPGGGTRAVVEARRGDRVVDQQPVDYQPGERYHVVLDIP